MIEDIGNRLRVAREARGLTQEAAASQLRMARTTLVAIEGSQRAVRPAELVAFASLYSTTVNALARRSAVTLELKPEFRRGREGVTNDPDAIAAFALLTRLASSYVELEERLDQPLARNYPKVARILRGGVEQQAEDLALEVRSRLGLGTAPINDLVDILESELGVRIFFHPLPSDIAGVYAFHERSGACVIVNSKHPKARQLWTLAHELGHLLTSRDTPSVLRTGNRDPSEYFADLFAGAFLAPSSTVRRLHSEFAVGGFSPKHLILMSNRFGLSLEAMCRRMERLGLLTKGTFEALRDRGLDSNVVDAVLGPDTPAKGPSRPTRLLVLSALAYERGLFSEQQIGALLSLPLVAVRELLDALDTSEWGELT
jgi:Zn-dependent peptidase ImmA (M78 family)/DNA-binding XRE family transcriptional regulator